MYTYTFAVFILIYNNNNNNIKQTLQNAQITENCKARAVTVTQTLELFECQ